MVLTGLEIIDMNWQDLLHLQNALLVSLPHESFAPNFLGHNFLGHWSLDGLFFAQAVRDTNVIGQMQDAFNNFIASGQVWALIIGFVIGYVIRGLTAG